MTIANQVNPVQQNAMNRALLLATGIRMTKHLQLTTGATLGQSVRIPLLRMGIMTGITVQVTVPITVATAALTPSALFPQNTVSKVQYTDFAGTNRVNTSAYQLWAAQSFKAANKLGLDYNESNVNSAVYTPTPATVAVGNFSYNFNIYIPCAYDPAQDLTGSVLTQTNVGEHYVTLTFANALVGNDQYAAPFNSATGTATLQAAGITIDVFQHYIQPQSMQANQLPLIDLATIYGFEGGYQTTANIAAAQSTFINYPNNRSVLSSLILFENGNTFTANGTDISGVTLVANSNTNFRELTPKMMFEIQRQILKTDIGAGVYYMPHRRQPILTQLYANVQAKFDVAGPVNAGVTQFVSQFEVQYPSGSPLPGITVAS